MQLFLMFVVPAGQEPYMIVAYTCVSQVVTCLQCTCTSHRSSRCLSNRHVVLLLDPHSQQVQCLPCEEDTGKILRIVIDT